MSKNDGLILTFDGATGYFPKEFIIEAIKTHTKVRNNIGDFSDGYHTFNELYHHRAVLFSVICNKMPEKAWKSKLHDTGDMFNGMFIVGIETEQGQATYHYDIEPYWDMFKVKELEKAPKWDGHTPADAIQRIGGITSKQSEVSEVVEKLMSATDKVICEAKAEVAREIFEEIEKVIGEQYENYVFDNIEIEGVEQDAIITFADAMKRHFAELKKKYTEGEAKDG